MKQSMDVITVPDESGEKALISTEGMKKDAMNLLIACELYKVWKMEVETSVNVEQKYPFLLGSVLDGCGRVNEYELKKGDHFMIPAEYGNVKFEGNMELILCTV